MEQRHFIRTAQLQALLDSLRACGYRCIGPRVRDGAIVFDTVTDIDQLPRGVNDIQEPGRYSLQQGSSDRYFDWANGPQALKPNAMSTTGTPIATTRPWIRCSPMSIFLSFPAHLPKLSQEVARFGRPCAPCSGPGPGSQP